MIQTADGECLIGDPLASAIFLYLPVDIFLKSELSIWIAK